MKSNNLLPFAALVLSLALLAACSQTSVPEVPSIITLDDPSTLYGQLDKTSVFASAFSDYAADDFVVPPGEIWTITKVGLDADVSNLISPDSYAIAFFAANEGEPEHHPGDLISEQTYSPEDASERDGLVIIRLPQSVKLTEGTYWIGVNGWLVTQREKTGYPMVVGSEGNFSGDIDRTYDLAFALFGTRTSSEPPVITIYENGAIHRKAGTATVSGTLTCEIAEVVTLRVELRQRKGKNPIEGMTDISVNCDGETQWAAALTASSGKFKSGLADAAAEIMAADRPNRVLRVINLR